MRCMVYRLPRFFPVRPDLLTGSNWPLPLPCIRARFIFSSFLLSFITPTLPASTSPRHRSPTLRPSLPSVLAHSAQSVADKRILARTIPTSCLSSSSLQGPMFLRVAESRFDAGPRIRLLLGVTNGSSSSSSSLSGWKVTDSILGAAGQMVGVDWGSGVTNGSASWRGVESRELSLDCGSGVAACAAAAAALSLRLRLLLRVTMVYVYVYPVFARGVSTSISPPLLLPGSSSAPGVVHGVCCGTICFEGVCGLGVLLGVGVARSEWEYRDWLPPSAPAQ
ncbi:hypothetical protein ABW21_db0209321 [Orbilia brochopaga]|nr:hypothetical protein ABW21_db0209321 [Drechslerella brochopaga]